MSIDLDSLPDGLFTKLGRLAHSYNRVVSSFGASLDTDVSQIASGYRTYDGQVTDSLYATRDSYRGVHGTYLSAIQSLTQNTIIEQVNRDTPLTSKTLANAVTELADQMDGNSESIQRPTTSVLVTADGDNLGDSMLVASLTNEYGDPLDMVFAEDVRFTCTADSASGATQYQETLTIQGEPSKSVTAYDWPGGSGATGTISLRDAAVTGLISNGDFATWSGSPLAPGSWTIGTGTAGTHIVRSSTVLRANTNYTGSFVSDGSTLPDLYQTVSLSPNRVYVVNLWAKINSTDSTGTFRVRLTNGSNTVLTDDAGNNLQATWGVNGGAGIGTSFTQLTAFFSTPRQLPSTIRFHLELSVSPTSGRTVNFGLVSIGLAQQLYAGGPFLGAFSLGATNPTARGDKWVLTVDNNATTASFTRYLDRTLNLRTLGLYLPSASSPTISNSLLT